MFSVKKQWWWQFLNCLQMAAWIGCALPQREFSLGTAGLFWRYINSPTTVSVYYQVHPVAPPEATRNLCTSWRAWHASRDWDWPCIEWTGTSSWLFCCCSINQKSLVFSTVDIFWEPIICWMLCLSTSNDFISFPFPNSFLRSVVISQISWFKAMQSDRA